MSEPSIKKNFAYKSALTISTYLMNFVTFPYVSRILGVDGIGLVSFVDNTVNYFLLFASMGVGILGVREIAAAKNDKEKCNKIFSNILGMNVGLTFVTLIVYWICVRFIPDFNQYDELFYIGGAKILFTAFLVEWYFTGMENFRYITLRSLFVKLLYVIIVFMLIHSKDDYKLYFVLTVAVVVVNAIINMIYVCKYVKIQPKELFDLKYIKQNIFLGVYSLMTSLYLTFNVMFLGLVGGNIEVGYYTTAFKLYSVVLGFFTAFTNVMLPRMSVLLADGKDERFRQLINKSLNSMFAFSVPMVVCSIVLAPQIVYILSGSGYEGAILPMRIIMPAVLLVGIAQVLAIQILMPMHDDKILLFASIFGGVVSLLINITLVPYVQSVGSALVLICSELVVTLVYVIYILRKRLFVFQFRIFFNNLVYSLPCLIICYLCGEWIKNYFWCVGLAVLLSASYWIILQIKLHTEIGSFFRCFHIR